MKFIEDTLKLVNKTLSSIDKAEHISVALIGGYAVIAHGVQRTTTDVDFCIYSNSLHRGEILTFIELLKKVLPSQFQIRLLRGSKDLSDPFQHDVIFIEDTTGKYPRIDLIVIKYKWELQGAIEAKLLKDIPLPILPKPYLIAMKLKAGSFKDDLDVHELYKLLTKAEIKKTNELAKLIHRDKALAKILKPRTQIKDKDDPNLLI